MQEDFRQTLRSVMSELYNEVRHRRDIIFKLITYYSGICGLSIGWMVSGSKTITLTARFVLAVIIFVLGCMVINSLKNNGRVYATIARTIVRISEELCLFGSTYPNEWHKWGEKHAHWPAIGMAVVMLATASFVMFGK